MFGPQKIFEAGLMFEIKVKCLLLGQGTYYKTSGLTQKHEVNQIKKMSGTDTLALIGSATLSMMTVSIMKVSIMTVSIMTISIMTVSIMTVSIMTVSIMTVSIMTFSITIHKYIKSRHSALRHSALWQIVVIVSFMPIVINNMCCKSDLYAECHYAECRYAECLYAECRGALYFTATEAKIV